MSSGRGCCTAVGVDGYSSLVSVDGYPSYHERDSHNDLAVAVCPERSKLHSSSMVHKKTHNQRQSSSAEEGRESSCVLFEEGRGPHTKNRRGVTLDETFTNIF